MKDKGEAEMTGWNKCPGCGGTISGASDYCPNCGEPWTIKCPNCGITQRFWKFQKFCTSCGTRIEWHAVIGSKQKKIPHPVG